MRKILSVLVAAIFVISVMSHTSLAYSHGDDFEKTLKFTKFAMKISEKKADHFYSKYQKYDAKGKERKALKYLSKAQDYYGASVVWYEISIYLEEEIDGDSTIEEPSFDAEATLSKRAKKFFGIMSSKYEKKLVRMEDKFEALEEELELAEDAGDDLLVQEIENQINELEDQLYIYEGLVDVISESLDSF